MNREQLIITQEVKSSLRLNTVNLVLVAQLEEHKAENLGVAGSSPV